MESINIKVEEKNRTKFCQAAFNVKKFCLIDSKIREKDIVECDIYTYLLKTLNCDQNIDKFD